jgi:hypothetical protein
MAAALAAALTDHRLLLITSLCIRYYSNGLLMARQKPMSTNLNPRMMDAVLLKKYEYISKERTPDTVVTAARKQIRDLFYTKDSPDFKFETYCIGHIEANADLRRYQVEVDGPSQIIDFITGIKAPELQFIKPSILNDPECKDNLNKAAEKFKTNMVTSLKYNPAKMNDKKNTRYIGASDTNFHQGHCHNSGRGSNRGRGQYGGRGRDHDYSYYNHNQGRGCGGHGG